MARGARKRLAANSWKYGKLVGRSAGRKSNISITDIDQP